LTLFALGSVVFAGVFGCGCFALSVGSVACHRLFDLLHIPVRISVLLCVIVTVVSVNVAMHCASQSCPTDIRDVVPRAGKMCAIRALAGKFGKSNSAVCVAFIIAWFGKRTLMPVVVLCLFVYGADTARKWPVQPVSMIKLWDDVEGPRGKFLVFDFVAVTGLFTCLAPFASPWLLLGSPRPHFSSGLTSSSVLPLGVLRLHSMRVMYWNTTRSLGMRRMKLLPPHMFCHVASFTCPFAGYLQVALLCTELGFVMRSCMSPCDQQ